MKTMRMALSLVLCLVLLTTALPGPAFSQDHLKRFDGVRASMTRLGGDLPELLRKAQPRDIRTLERLFEINNYALVTIESYLKMIKISVSAGGKLNKDAVNILNGWLKFIAHYAEYDIKYIDEALAETQDKAIVDLLVAEKKNISELKESSEIGMKENSELLPKL